MLTPQPIKGARFAFATPTIPTVNIDACNLFSGNADQESITYAICARFAEKGLNVSHRRQTDDGILSLYFEGEDPHKVMRAVGELWHGLQ